MRRIIFSLCVIALFNFYSAQKLWANESSELKTQMKAMQKQMEIMQKKIEKLEAEKQARIETPKEMEDRVTA